MSLSQCLCVSATILATAAAHAQIDKSPVYFGQWGTPGSPGGKFQDPTGTAADNQFVYVADSNNNRIQKFDLGGGYVTLWGQPGSAAGQFNSPRGLAVSVNENGYGAFLYVADKNNNRIQKFTIDGAFVAQWGSAGSSNGKFNAPRDVAVIGNASAHIVYVLDSGNNRIQKFDANGAFIAAWGSAGSGNGQFDFPLGIAVDAPGNVYVSDNGNSRIQKFTADGIFITAWASPSPWGITAKRFGNLYVANKDSASVQEFTTGGILLNSWGLFGTGNGEFDTPAGVATNWNNSFVFVVDGGNHRVQRFSLTGGFQTKWGAEGSGNSQFFYPKGIAIDPMGRIYVADTINDRIQVFTREGVFITTWGVAGSGDGQFADPHDIAVDSFGNVYVADTDNYRIQKFDSSGTFVTKWGSGGSADGQLNRPRAVAVDRSGAVYVADTFNDRIQAFTSAGQFLRKWGAGGSADGYFRYPVGLALDDSGYVYVTDLENNRTQKFTNAGTFVTKWYTPYPGDLAVDPLGYVYVTYAQGHHIWKFTTAGTLLAEWGTSGSGDSQFLYPNDVAIEPNGNVYVVDANNNRIQRFRYVNGLGVYGDSNGTQRSVCATQAVPETLHLLATTGRATSSGITKAEFRIEATNPAGYFFSYIPPANGIASGDPFTSGTTVVFQSCQPPALPRAEGDKVLLGTITVFNLGGGATDLLVKPKQGSCPLFYQCDAPFFTSACMSSAESDSIFFRTSINGPSCEPAAPQPFVTETLFLDTHEAPMDGAAGPVTTLQALDSRQSFLVTVEGTLSLWPASSWGPPPIVICGTPEIAPQFPSPGVTNGWVGVDAELDFSVPLAPGGNCTDLPSQGYPPHPGSFRIDLGSGFSHMEPLGGMPSDPWPDHLYRYLVQGQDAPVRFAWFDSATADNYGMLRIVVSQQEPTDTPIVTAQPRFTLLPNVPNPFNPSTEIRYELPEACHVDVVVFDVRGRVIRRIFSGWQSPGYQSLRWNGRLDDGRIAGSGVYFTRVLTPVGVSTRRVTLIK